MTEERSICGAECHYGGLSAARKGAGTDLGWMWHCNRRVRTAGQRCYQHPDRTEPAVDMPEPTNRNVKETP